MPSGSAAGVSLGKHKNLPPVTHPLDAPLDTPLGVPIGTPMDAPWVLAGRSRAHLSDLPDGLFVVEELKPCLVAHRLALLLLDDGGV